MSETDFKFLLDKIQRNKGADFSLYRTATLKRRIDSRMRTTGCLDYSDYIIYLNKNPEEYDNLISAITINVTEFFRNPETFTILEKKVIPEIIRSKKERGRKVIRAWSAGTSNGEEAYSLAVLFLEALKENIADFDVVVYGTDVDPACIEKGKAGIYTALSIKEIDKERLAKYFNKNEESYEINDNVKKLTKFTAHNLVSDEFLKHLDLILCRNVIIYFTRPLQEMVYSNFARALNKGGILVLGKVESLWGYAKENFEIFDNRERIYRKQ
ncbi:MAG: protein-glutamate O-methyltransferase CheR [Candidatus Omnitrophota bacterium]